MDNDLFDENGKLKLSSGDISHHSNGIPYDAEGVIAIGEGDIANFQNGLPYDAGGKLVVEESEAAVYVNGYPRTASGKLAVDQSGDIINFQGGIGRTASGLAVSGLAFTPGSIAGLIAWFDVSQGDLRDSYLNGTPVTTDGASVGYMLSQVNDILLGNGGMGSNRRPTLVAGAQNGLDVLNFDQTGTYAQLMGMSSAAKLKDFLPLDKYTIFVVVKPVSLLTSTGVPRTEGFLVGGEFSGSYCMNMSAAGVLSHTVRDGSSSYKDATVSGVTTGSFGIARAVKGGGEHYVAWNGTAGTAVASGDVLGPLDGFDEFTVCNPGDWNKANGLNAQIAEIIVYDSGLSTENCEEVEVYLTEKWAI